MPEDLEKPRGNTDEEIFKRLRLYVDEAAAEITQIHQRAEDNMKFVSGVGDQWLSADRKRYEGAKLPALNMNELHKAIEQISGQESTARFEPRAIDRTGEAGPLAEASNEFIRATRADCAAEPEESDTFRDLCIMSYGWIDVVTDLRGRLPKTEIINIPIYEMLWDTTCRRRNLQDRQWHIRGKWVGRAKFEASWPEHAGKFEDQREDPSLDWGMEKSQESSRVPWINFTKGRFWDRKTDQVFAVEAEWKDAERLYEVDLPYEVFSATAGGGNGTGVPGPRILSETDVDDLSPFGHEERGLQTELVERLRQAITSPAPPQIDEQTGTPIQAAPVTIEVANEYLDLLQADLDAAGIRFFDIERDVYRWAFAVGDKVLDKGRRPEGYWTKLVMTGFGEKQPDKTVFYSPVDVSKDHQRWTNKVYSLMVEILSKQAKGSYKIMRGAIKKVSDLARKLGRPGALIEVDDMNSIQALEGSRFPAEIKEFFDISRTAVSEQMGLNAAASGNVGGDLRRISGEVVASLQQTAQATLAGLFTSLEQLRRELGKLLMMKMYTYYTREDLARVIGREKAGALPESRHQWRAVLDLQVTVDQVPTLPSERHHTLEMFTNTALAQTMMQPLPGAPTGFLPPQYIIKLMDFPATDKAEIMAHIEQVQAGMLAAAQQQPPASPPAG